jgi:hypothetical protein
MILADKRNWHGRTKKRDFPNVSTVFAWRSVFRDGIDYATGGETATGQVKQGWIIRLGFLWNDPIEGSAILSCV